jgi:hypothetical protein
VPWVKSSYDTQNENLEPRQNARIPSPAPERAAMREVMMVVVNLVRKSILVVAK